VDVVALDLDAVDQAELDEVEAELRVDDVRQRRFDIFDSEHAAESSRGGAASGARGC
jgi:hypothetical protein